MRIRFYVTGGTFDKEYDELNGALYFKDTHIRDMLRRGRCNLNLEIRTLMMIDSQEMTDVDREMIRKACAESETDRIVITHGTDTLENTARFLDEHVKDKTIVLVGAMVPYTFGSSDGMFNLGSALAWVQTRPHGVYVVMNGRCFDADNVRKNRYVSIDPSTNGDETIAIQAELACMMRCSGDLSCACRDDGECPTGTGPCVEHPDVGTILGWVDEPDENGVSAIVSTPVFRVWPEEFVHIGACAVIPVATYEFRATLDGVILTSPIEVGTIAKPDDKHYGDTVGVGTGLLWPELGFTPPNGIININDVQAYGLTAAGIESPSADITWVDLHGLGEGRPPNFILNVSDLQSILFGYEGQTFIQNPEHKNPSDCP